MKCPASVEIDLCDGLVDTLARLSILIGHDEEFELFDMLTDYYKLYE